MSEQFRRAWSLQVDTLLIRPREAEAALRVSFSVERNEKKYPNNVEIAIWNLSEDTRNRMNQFDRGVTVIMQAGYGTTTEQIFIGDLRWVEHNIDGADVITRISAGDGEQKISVSMCSKTFAKGTTHTKVLSEIAATLGLPLGNISKFFTLADATGGTKLTKSLAFSGPSADVLTAFGLSMGITWSVQNAELSFRRDTESAGGFAPLISPKTGLIGSPKISPPAKGAKLKGGIVSGTALILPGLVPGVSFEISSKRVNGTFVATKTKHYGDTYGREWYVDFEGQEL